MPLKLVEATAPTVEPVTVADAKSHCRIDLAEDDALLSSMITTARVYVERKTNRQLLEATYQLYTDAFPAAFELPRSPASSVTSITYVDTGGSTQTLAATEYTLDAYREPAVIMPAYLKSWPSTQDVPNAVCVTFKAGYGSTATTVPVALRQAVLMHVAHQYENRSATDQQAPSTVPLTVDSVCKLYEVPIVP